MSENIINARMKQKIDTSSNWKTKNPILFSGELGIESDTRLVKFGDGVKNWNNLGYINDFKFSSIQDLVFISEISGNGVITDITIVHNRNNSTPIVFVYNEEGKRLYPEISVLDSNRIKISYIYPLASDSIHRVIVM